MPSLLTIATFVLYAAVFYNVARFLVWSRGREIERRDAAERDRTNLDRRDGWDGHDEQDGDTATLARSRARAAAAVREMEHARRVRQVSFAASLVAETTRNRFILVPALVAVTVLASVVGGPLPGGCIATVCVLMAMVPLVARSWLESQADEAVHASGLDSDDPLFVPDDWSRWPPR